MSNVWVINSGKGGVGKTTLAASMAVCLAQKYSQRVAVIDADIGLSAMDVLLGMPNVKAARIEDYADGVCALSEMLRQHTEYPGLYLIPAARDARPSDTSRKDFKRLTDALRESFDTVIIDCPAGIGHAFSQTLVEADAFAIVATPDDVSIRDAARVHEMMLTKGVKLHPCLIVNRIIPSMIRSRHMRTPLDIAMSLNMPLVGAIEQNEQVTKALLLHKTPFECVPSQRPAIEEMTAHLLNGSAICADVYAPRPRRLFMRGKGREA